MVAACLGLVRRLSLGFVVIPCHLTGSCFFWTGEGGSPKGRLRKVARVAMVVAGVKWNKGVK
jgi:hypothetical protein